MNQTEEDYLIYDADDEAINMVKTHTTKAKLIPFSLTKTFNEGAYIKITKWKLRSIKKSLQWIQNTLLRRKHNMKNAMAATSVAKLMQIENYN
jgi:UDP-N-acetylmuramoylalanine--D-glutamate ligase